MSSMSDIMSLWANEPDRFSSRSADNVERDAVLQHVGAIKQHSNRAGALSAYDDDAMKRMTTARLTALRESLNRILNSETALHALCDGGLKLRTHIKKIDDALIRRSDGGTDLPPPTSAPSLEDITERIAAMSVASRAPLSAPSRVAYLSARESVAIQSADEQIRRRHERELNFKLAQRGRAYDHTDDDDHVRVDYESERADDDDDDDADESDSAGGESDIDDMRVPDIVERFPSNVATTVADSPFVRPITAVRTTRVVRIGAASSDGQSRRVRFADSGGGL